jgi:hypothetical protein
VRIMDSREGERYWDIPLDIAESRYTIREQGDLFVDADAIAVEAGEELRVYALPPNQEFFSYWAWLTLPLPVFLGFVLSQLRRARSNGQAENETSKRIGV